MSRQSGAGIVLPEPFAQADLDAAVARMRDPALPQSHVAGGHPLWPRRPRRSPASIRPPTSSNGRWRPSRSRRRRQRNAAVSRRTVPRYIPISIIVTTYNRPDALDAVLRGLARQSDKDFEVVVADDGSTPDTADAC